MGLFQSDVRYRRRHGPLVRLFGHKAMTFKTLDALNDCAGKRVLVRVDLNVPMMDGKVTDSTRLEALKPTVDTLLAKGARILLLAHFGRPKGKTEPSLSLRSVIPALQETLGHPVAFLDHGEKEKSQAPAAPLTVLENTRFLPGEEKNDPATARQFAALGDIYVNDAFSAAHRAHSSTEALAHLLPAYAGLSMAQELSALESALQAPARPAAAVVGGAKVSSKISVLKNLVEKVDHLIIGGGMANTFLLARGVPVGKSLAEKDYLDTAREIETLAAKSGCHLHLPVDAVVAKEFKAGAANRTLPFDAIEADDMILDCGPDSISALKPLVATLKTFVWNGPMGAFELSPFDWGTNQLARLVADQAKNGSLTAVAGGGDTVAALSNAGVLEDFSYISTAGGAFLEWMEGRDLPGVTALTRP